MKSSWFSTVGIDDSLYENVQEIAYRAGGNPLTTLYVSLPRGKRNFPTLVFFHGGGLTGDDPQIPKEFYDGEYAVIHVRYRLCPAVDPRDILDDAALALTTIFRKLPEWGGDPARVLVSGQSAGAYLAAMIGMDERWLARYGADRRRIAGLLLLSGQMTTHFYVKEMLQYTRQGVVPVIDELAPLYYASQDLPPILCVTGEGGLDMPARPEENAFFIATLQSLGHPMAEYYALPGLDHGTSFPGSWIYMRVFADKIWKARGL